MKYNPLIILVLLLHFFVLGQEVVEQENECTCDNYYVNVLSYSSVSNEIIDHSQQLYFRLFAKPYSFVLF